MRGAVMMLVNKVTLAYYKSALGGRELLWLGSTWSHAQLIGAIVAIRPTGASKSGEAHIARLKGDAGLWR